jgi:hypothetical protein
VCSAALDALEVRAHALHHRTCVYIASIRKKESGCGTRKRGGVIRRATKHPSKLRTFARHELRNGVELTLHRVSELIRTTRRQRSEHGRALHRVS